MTVRSGWLLLILFVLSYGLGSLQPMVRAEHLSTAAPSVKHEVFPYALLTWRAQTHHQITIPLATVAELDLPDCSHLVAFASVWLFEAGASLLPSADPLYLLMSLQR